METAESRRCVAPLSRLYEEDAMAKGQQRSNREKKKPKQDKKKVLPPASPIGSAGQRGKPGQGGGNPKKG